MFELEVIWMSVSMDGTKTCSGCPQPPALWQLGWTIPFPTPNGIYKVLKVNGWMDEIAGIELVVVCLCFQ